MSFSGCSRARYEYSHLLVRTLEKLPVELLDAEGLDAFKTLLGKVGSEVFMAPRI